MLLFIVAAAALSRAGDTKPTVLPQDNGSFAALKKSYDDAKEDGVQR